ncbi:zinc ribbon domain-containing protein [Paenibacillus rhizosphaerae]
MQKTLYLFSRFLRCADCGKAMTRSTVKGNVYYYCRTHVQRPIQSGLYETHDEALPFGTIGFVCDQATGIHCGFSFRNGSTD